MAKLFVKREDTVVVITGKEKGKKAKVLEVIKEEGKVLVDGVNIVSRHQKPKSQTDKGGIIKKAAPIDASNVMIVCDTCKKATRVAHKEINGKKVRICKKCGASLDKAFAKQTKKEDKKVKKVAAAAPAPAAKAAPKITKEAKAAKTQTVKEAPKSSVRKTAPSSGK